MKMNIDSQNNPTLNVPFHTYNITVEDDIKKNLTLDECLILPNSSFGNTLLFTNLPDCTRDIELNEGDFNDLSKSNDSTINALILEEIADIVEAYKCKSCDFLTCDKLIMVSHYQKCIKSKIQIKLSESTTFKEDNDTMYICGKCSIPLPSVDECKRHMIEDHKFQEIPLSNDNTLNDLQNEKSTKTNRKDGLSLIKNKLPKAVEEYWSQPRTKKEAQSVLRGERKIKCTFKQCMYKFNSNESMIIHKSCHANIAPTKAASYQRSPQRTPTPLYMCSFCKTNFNNWPSCSLHLWREHKKSLDLILCPLCCRVRTHSVSKMIQHLARHWRNCNRKTESTKKDENSEANDKITKLPRWYGKIQCEICNKSFTDCKSLKTHIQCVHKKIKPFICNVCGHSTSKKHTLQLHMRQHTGEKPYVCTYCNHRTGDHNTLRKHIMRHTGERPYKCNYCTYSSIQSGTLKLHIKSAHKKEITN